MVLHLLPKNFLEWCCLVTMMKNVPLVDEMFARLVRKTSNDTLNFYFFPRKKFPVSSLGFMCCPNSDIYLFLMSALVYIQGGDNSIS